MKKEIFEYTPEEVIRCNRLIGEFMGLIFLDEYKFKTTENGIIRDRHQLKYFSDWNKLMDVIDKIEKIGVGFEIREYHSYFYWWYSKRKTNFEWKEPRTPFDSIGGKHYSRCVGVGQTAEKINCKTRLEATYNNVVYFIEWYNKTVLNK